MFCGKGKKPGDPVLLYHRLMLPTWLRENAEWSSDYDGDDLRLIIKEDSASWEHILRVQMMPADLVEADADLTVNIVIGTKDADTENNPLSVMLSDSDFAMGFQLASSDSGSVRAVEGEPGKTLRNPNLNLAASAPNKGSSGEITVSLKPSSAWGKAVDQGVAGANIVAQYSDSLDLSKGLQFEMYRYKSSDTYVVNYVEVTVYKDSPKLYVKES